MKRLRLWLRGPATGAPRTMLGWYFERALCRSGRHAMVSFAVRGGVIEGCVRVGCTLDDS